MLYVRVEILHAERSSRDTRTRIRRRVLGSQRAGIDFDCVRGRLVNVEPEADMTPYSRELFWAQDVGGAASPMDIAHEPRMGCPGDQVNLPPQRLSEVRYRIIAARGVSVAPAIPANLATIGYVEIEGERRVRLKFCQPAAISECVYVRAEVRCSRITSVARRVSSCVGKQARVHARD